MRTRSSDNWSCLPGYFDVHNTFKLYESTNEFGIPDLLHQETTPPDNLVPYNIRIRSNLGYKGLGVHFFLDDYRFENVWVRPHDQLGRVKAAEVALTPDFSLYLDFPRAIQIYNTYKARWVGRFWQANGVQVVPTISWADEQSYDFCFAGIPKTSNIAISTVSINRDNSYGFLKGYEKALEVIEPKTIMCYGKILPEMVQSHNDIKPYTPSFRGLKALRKKKSEEVPKESNLIKAC